jgi:5-(carboxyamino)imidazole ribonucleotide synthase
MHWKSWKAKALKSFRKPSVLRIIKNKAAQKKFYTEHQIPTAAYSIIQSNGEINQHLHLLPAVQKLAKVAMTVAAYN